MNSFSEISLIVSGESAAASASCQTGGAHEVTRGRPRSSPAARARHWPALVAGRPRLLPAARARRRPPALVASFPRSSQAARSLACARRARCKPPAPNCCHHPPAGQDPATSTSAISSWTSTAQVSGEQQTHIETAAGLRRAASRHRFEIDGSPA